MDFSSHFKNLPKGIFLCQDLSNPYPGPDFRGHGFSSTLIRVADQTAKKYISIKKY